MAVVLYRVKVTKVIRVKKVITKVRVNALPFMPFYDALCPLVPDNEMSQCHNVTLSQGVCAVTCYDAL